MVTNYRDIDSIANSIDDAFEGGNPESIIDPVTNMQAANTELAGWLEEALRNPHLAEYVLGDIKKSVTELVNQTDILVDYIEGHGARFRPDPRV